MRRRLFSARHQNGFSRGIFDNLEIFFAKLKLLVEYKNASQAVSWDIVEFLRMALAKNNRPTASHGYSCLDLEIYLTILSQRTVFGSL